MSTINVTFSNKLKKEKPSTYIMYSNSSIIKVVKDSVPFFFKVSKISQLIIMGRLIYFSFIIGYF